MNLRMSTVIIGGNTVGTEVAANLALNGKAVTLLKRTPEGPGLGMQITKTDLIKLAAEHGAKRLTGWKPVEIRSDCVVAENAETGEQAEFPCDTVLIACGMTPRHDEAMKFLHCCPETNFFIIGDAVRSGDVRDAVFQAFEVTRSL